MIIPISVVTILLRCLLDGVRASNLRNSPINEWDQIVTVFCPNSEETVEITVPPHLLTDPNSTTVKWIKDYLIREESLEKLIGFREKQSSEFNIHNARGAVLDPSTTFADADIQSYTGLLVLRTDQNVSALHEIAVYVHQADPQLTKNAIDGQIRCIIYEVIRRSVRHYPGELVKMGVWVAGRVRRGLLVMETEKGKFNWEQKPFQEYLDFVVP